MTLAFLLPRSRLTSLFVCIVMVAANIRAEDERLDIYVRTTVSSPSGATAGTRKTYAVFPPVEVFSAERLARPIAAETVTGFAVALDEKLRAQGFMGINPKDKPELLITVQYGRSYLANPYDFGASGLSPEGSVGTRTFRGVGDLIKTREAGYQAKRQDADQEKLFFTVSAWDFASMQKGAKPVQYWTTTVFVDDPDHRDIGSLYPQMLSVAANFFNRQIDKEEIIVPTSLRSGKVDVGPIRVVPEGADKKRN